MRRGLAAVLWLACGVASAQPQGGVVFDDGNGNGVRDAGEAGIAGVAVSNGHRVVRTDGQGRYALQMAAGETIFVVKPAGWKVPAGAEGLPAFWRQQPLRAPSALHYGGLPAGPLQDRIDFALRRAPGPDTDLDVLLFADPQPKSRTDIDYYRRDIVAPLLGNTPATLGLGLGDIVDDDLSLYPAINAVTTSLHVPWLHVAGNHDMDTDAATDADALQTFRRHFGPDTFAWEESRATFVMLDDVIHQPGQKPAYVGGFRDDQFAFLEAYLPTVPKDHLLVLGMHIPLFEAAGRETFRDADRERLFALLRDFPHVLVLSAHSHTQQHWFHDAGTGWHGAQPLHEYNVGANCGAFWSGVKDADGIPDATMADGTPNGYATLRVSRDGEYALAWHPARLRGGDPAFTAAMALHAPTVLREGAYPAWGVYANVFMGRDDTRVEYRVDGGDWTPMAKVAQTDPRLLVENVRDDLADALRGYDRSPEAKPSAHLWRGALPTGLGIGEHRVEVRAFDASLGEQRATITYRLQGAVE
ncbi:calcineurin-like phosphoesterase C-terminal domain-containing protein [Luteimonas mephitis]|uniref:calcineurin-like phosphoesterase C-terminal domain-containing protein n=1 Tax=Luteimonas mephitis TaxID=83615 RepID=UPI003A9115B0